MSQSKRIVELIRENFLNKEVSITINNTIIGSGLGMISGITKKVKIKSPHMNYKESPLFEVYLDAYDNLYDDVLKKFEFVQSVLAYANCIISDGFTERFEEEIETVLKRPLFLFYFTVGHKDTEYYEFTTTIVNDCIVSISFGNIKIKLCQYKDLQK